MATAISSAKNDAAEIITRDKGQKGLTGDDGIDGAGFNQVRQSLLDSPLCRLFAPNDIAPVVAGSLTATRATTGTYIDRYGIVKTASADEMREESEGWLIEGESTNLILSSEEITVSAGWEARDGATPVYPLSPAPNGTNTFTRVSSTQPNAYMREVISNSTAANFTFSIWVKSPSSDRDINLKLRNLVSDNNSIDQDFTATSEWQRLSITLNSLASTLIVDIKNIAANLAIDYWGAQLEQQSGPSSYIPTTTAPVTRAADLITAQFNNNATKMGSNHTIVCNFDIGFFDSFNRIFQMDNNTNDSGTTENVVVNETGRLFYTNRNDTLLFNFENGFNLNSSFALVVKNNQASMYVNGVGDDENPALLTSTNDPNPTTLRLGSRPGGGVNLNGHLKDFRIYDFALNEDEIKYLSGVV